MAKWRDCKLGDLLEIKHGFAFLGEHFADRGTHIVLTPGNFFDEGGFKQKGAKEKWYNGPIPADYVLNEGDLIVAMTEQAEGLLGSSAMVPRSGLYLHNQRLGLVKLRDEKQTDKDFIYYLFNSKPVRQQIRGSASGTKIRHTAPSRIAEVKVSVPLLPVQRRIADILSAYDELIENSQRRIGILETMARTLYREWFVHFRFPGHENHPLVASPLGDTPKGWEVKKLGELADISWGDTSTTKASYVDEGYTAYSASGQDGQLDHFDFDRTGVVLSAIGAQCGKTWLARGKWSCIKNTIRFWSKNDEVTSTEFLFIATERQDFWPRRGAAQPFISQGDAERIALVTPDPATMKRFTAFAADALEHVSTLQKQIQNLRRTRDLLLPRLLSGQVKLVTEAA